jgi:thioredoxin reductase (NADPH)
MIVGVGEGNSAGQAAVYLARFASKVTIVVRGKSLSTSICDYLIRQVESLSNVEVLLGTRVVKGSGDKRLEAVGLGGRHLRRPGTNLFVLIGEHPTPIGFPAASIAIRRDIS